MSDATHVLSTSYMVRLVVLESPKLLKIRSAISFGGLELGWDSSYFHYPKIAGPNNRHMILLVRNH